MRKPFQFTVLLGLSAFLCTPLVFAQDDQAAPPVAADAGANTTQEPKVSSSQEVGINEDNYRQFMELKDNNLQRGIIPEEAFKPGTGLQKLEKLPEESQKHLRNELREIIVQGDPWQPGDEQDAYPYVPSQAAEGDPALQKQEIEAWGELVDSYHQREAQIYENASGRRAARGSEDGNRSTPGEGAGADGGTGQTEEGRLGQQAGQENTADQSGSAGTYSPGASNDPNATSTEGVSQNAMEFLKSLGKGGGSPQNSVQASNTESTAGASQNAMEFLQESPGQGESKAKESAEVPTAYAGQDTSQSHEAGDAQQSAQNESQDDRQTEDRDNGKVGGKSDGQRQDGLQTESEQKKVSVTLPAESAAISPVVPVEESVEGTSQNALEYLTERSAEGQNGNTDAPITEQPEGTLSIQDLLNAQGIGNPSGTATNPDDNKLEKDSGG
jgi:hypothetical protein